jgi:hypothetical protein
MGSIPPLLAKNLWAEGRNATGAKIGQQESRLTGDFFPFGLLGWESIHGKACREGWGIFWIRKRVGLF